MTARRTLVTVSWSLQRADHGEQPFWMGVALAAMTGSMGRPGGGFGSGYGAIHSVGVQPDRHRITALPQGQNRVTDEDARRAHRRPAARAGPADRLRRPAHHVPRRPPRLLVRRQPVPSPPGSEPPGARLAAARDRDRARVVVEPDRALRRHRLPGGHGAGAQRRRGRLGRLVDLGHAPGRRAARPRCAPTTRRCARWPSGSGFLDEFSEGRDGDEWVRHFYETTRADLQRQGRGASRRTRSSGRPAASRCRRRRCSARSTSPRCAPIRRRRRCPRRRAASRSPRPRSPASATTTARATRPGWSRPSGSDPSSRAASRCT